MLESCDVNIDEYPKVCVSSLTNNSNHYTFGDLHGNVVKLVFQLIQRNVVSMSSSNYQKMVTISKKPVTSLTANDLAIFRKAVDSMKVNSVGLVRLIGDETADRGSNDYFTLLVLQKLGKERVPVEILASNHGNEFVLAYERGDEYVSENLAPVHCGSLRNLQRLIDRGLVSRSEVRDIILKHYKPCLRMISYGLSKDKKTITIFSHAAIGLHILKSLSRSFNGSFDYNDTSAESLAITINRINHTFMHHVQNNTVHELQSKEIIFEGYQGNPRGLMNADTPFEFTTWNRHYDHLKRLIDHPNGFKMQWVHGHDAECSSRNVFCIDDSVGKCGASKGKLLMFVSQDLPPVKINYKSTEVVESENERFLRCVSELNEVLAREDLPCEQTLKAQASNLLLAVQKYQDKTDDKDYLLMINLLTKTKQALLNPADPQIANEFCELYELSRYRSSIGNIVGGIVLALLGACLLAAAITVTIASFGIATPLTALGIAVASTVAVKAVALTVATSGAIVLGGGVAISIAAGQKKYTGFTASFWQAMQAASPPAKVHHQSSFTHSF